MVDVVAGALGRVALAGRRRPSVDDAFQRIDAPLAVGLQVLVKRPQPFVHRAKLGQLALRHQCARVVGTQRRGGSRRRGSRSRRLRAKRFAYSSVNLAGVEQVSCHYCPLMSFCIAPMLSTRRL